MEAAQLVLAWIVVLTIVAVSAFLFITSQR
jgi:hypothetical protein